MGALARPDKLDLIGVFVAEHRDGGLGEPSRDPNPQRTRHEFQHGPAPSFVERIKPLRELRRKVELTEQGKSRDHFGERRCSRW